MVRPSATTAADTRTRLLEATIVVLDAGGDAAVRVRDIWEQVGVAATSLDHFFGSREGLTDDANAEG